MKNFKRFTVSLLALCIAFLLLPSTLSASGVIDTARDCALTINYADGETSISGASFSIYKIAEVDAYGGFTTTPDFSGFNVDIKGKDDEAWRTLASTLEGYVLRDSITPTDKGVTDSQGILSFRPEKLSSEPDFTLSSALVTPRIILFTSRRRL